MLLSRIAVDGTEVCDAMASHVLPLSLGGIRDPEDPGDPDDPEDPDTQTTPTTLAGTRDPEVP